MIYHKMEKILKLIKHMYIVYFYYESSPFPNLQMFYYFLLLERCPSYKMGKNLYEDSNTYVLPHIHLEVYPGFKPAGTINPNIYAVHNEETS